MTAETTPSMLARLPQGHGMRFYSLHNIIVVKEQSWRIFPMVEFLHILLFSVSQCQEVCKERLHFGLYLLKVETFGAPEHRKKLWTDLRETYFVYLRKFRITDRRFITFSTGADSEVEYCCFPRQVKFFLLVAANVATTWMSAKDYYPQQPLQVHIKWICVVGMLFQMYRSLISKFAQRWTFLNNYVQR